MFFLDFFVYVAAVAAGTYLGQALFRKFPPLEQKWKEALLALRSGRNAE